MGAILTYQHGSNVYAVAWSPDGKLIASGGSRDNNETPLQVWTATTGHRLFADDEYDDVNAVAWAPDNRRIAVTRHDSVEVWDTTTQQRLLKYRADYNSSVSWSPNGKYIASGGENGSVGVWDVMTRKEVFPFRFTNLGHYSGVLKDESARVKVVAWAPDSIRLAVGGGVEIQVWNIATQQRLMRYSENRPGEFGGVDTLAWAPHGKRLVSGGFGNIVPVLDAATGDRLLNHQHELFDHVPAVAWSPDGSRIASGGEKGTVRVWNALTGQRLFTYTGHTSKVTAVAWSPDGKYIASGSEDETVQAWSPA